MAYREKVWNPNVLTDLLSTYLTHKAGEREKYYQAELKKKPTYTQFGDELLKYDSAGRFLGVQRTKDPTMKNLNTLYPVGEGQPIMTRQVGAETQYINPSTEQWEIMPPDVLKGYKTDVPRTETTLPYVTWNKKTDEGYQEKSVLKGQKPTGDRWSVGQAPKDTITGYVTWYKRNEDGTFEEKSVLKGTKPSEEGYVAGHAPKSAITPVYRKGEHRKFTVGTEIVEGEFTGLDKDMIGDAEGWKPVVKGDKFKPGTPSYKIFGNELIKINPDGTTEVERNKLASEPKFKEFPQADRTKIFAKWMGPNYKQTPKDKESGVEPEYKFISRYSMDKDSQSWSDRKKAVVRYATAQEKRYLDIKQKKFRDVVTGKPFLDWSEEEHGPTLKFYQEVIDNPDTWMEGNEGLPVYKKLEPFRFGQQPVIK